MMSDSLVRLESESDECLAAELDPTDCGPQWRMLEICAKEEPHCIVWPHPIWMMGVASSKSLVAHCTGEIDRRLARGYIKAFKIGLTSNPLRRWICDDHSMRGYRAEGYHRLQVLFSTCKRGVVGPIEREVLKIYRRYDYETGGVTASGGNLLGANLRRGGENADFGDGSFCLYVAWQFNPGADELASQRFVACQPAAVVVCHP